MKESQEKMIAHCQDLEAEDKIKIEKATTIINSFNDDTFKFDIFNCEPMAVVNTVIVAKKYSEFTICSARIKFMFIFSLKLPFIVLVIIVKM